jgi:platelet-activating factor acetylhydrolase IB subunit alpha
MELEQKNAQLQEELATAPTSRKAAGLTGWVPRNPSRHTLQGHRSQVLRATFHPIFSLVVSVSDDATIKVWDWETGEFERTLKAHTKAVHDADFDSKGNLLGETIRSILIEICYLIGMLSYSDLLFRYDNQSVGYQR